MADTVTPWRPAAPSVVTTLTVHAAWLMPCKNRCLNPGSISLGCAPAFLSLIRPFACSDTPLCSLAWRRLTPLDARGGRGMLGQATGLTSTNPVRTFLRLA